MRFYPPDSVLDLGDDGLSSQMAPTIKAIYPSSSTFGSPQTAVTRKTDNTIGISFGYSPYGSLTIGHTGTSSFSTSTSSNFISSGLETSTAMMTIAEDPSTKSGVPAAFDFAFLVYLPAALASEPDPSFSCDLEVEASVGSFPSRLWSGGDRTFKMAFDGKVELGRLELGGVVEVHRQPGAPARGTINDGSAVRSTESSLGLLIQDMD